jgi:hypothetical protein
VGTTTVNTVGLSNTNAVRTGVVTTGGAYTTGGTYTTGGAYTSGTYGRPATNYYTTTAPVTYT